MAGNKDSPIKIRAYQDNDFLPVTALEDAGIGSLYRSGVFVRQMGACCPDTFLVAVDGTEPVGYLVGSNVQDTTGTAWILRVGVMENYRCNGVGTALLSAIIDVFRNKGVREIFLTVAPENQPALCIYQRQGFVQVKECRAYFGPGYDRLVLKKQIK
ncbi:MAG: GNAT family N-acetyltransferase [Methanoregula sp.]